MRRLAAGFLAGLLVLSLGWTAAPTPAAAASADPKVVLVVGATHGTTAAYRSYMSAVATTASRYSRNVVKVYSPNATWAAVRSALQGASIVVYMGHGNGFPSPYSTTPNPYTQNGMGLNLAAGAGDSNTKYYGEAYIANEVDLAPNAVVILSHLCYASGNSEPGKTEPTLSVAKARMDNFAAGFLRAGARAVIAEGHSDPSYYVEQLFTTHRTVEQIWRAGPRPHGNVFTFPSVRSTGYTVWSDPDSRSGSGYTGFYRSLVTKPTITSDMVTGARYARTDAHPGWFVVPGAAEVAAPDGAGLYPDATMTADPATGLAPATLPVGTRLRVLAAAGTAADGTAIYEVAALGGTEAGFALATGLTPRDSAPPSIWEVDAGTAAFSPNGDGSGDTVTVTAAGSEAVAWAVEITDAAGAVLARLEDDGDELAVTWNGIVNGAPVPDGTYTARITAVDAWGNAPATAEIDLVVDTVAPTLEGVSPQAVTPAVFTPNGDGLTDVARVGFGSSEAGTILATARDAGGAVTATFSGDMVAGPGSIAWDGRTTAGGYVPDGTHTIALRPVDRAGNQGTALDVSVVAYGALGFVKSSVVAMHALDRDRFAKTTTLSYRLSAPATVTWRLHNAAGAVIATRQEARELAAGVYTWTWNGRLPNGAWAPSGIYSSRVTATDGTTTVTQVARFHVNAFRLSLSDSTPGRGQRITVSIVTTEPLRAAPRLTYTQPGRAPVVVRTTRTSTSVYRVTILLSRGGKAGSLVLRVNGYDVGAGYNWSRYTYPIH
ncbi:MAG: FlgD immunoglobulin-like domain containing protein [Chloroflexota bacterium]